MEEYLRTNEFDEVLSSMAMVSETAERAHESIYQWKWLIIALHNALQGLMVLALRNGNGLLCLKDRDAAAWLQAYREERDLPDGQLDTFLNLYKKIKSDRLLFFSHSRSFPAEPHNDKAIKMLNHLRNEFIHFTPKGWSLQILGLPDMALHCLEVATFLANECGNIMWRDQESKQSFDQELPRAIEALTELQVVYTQGR